MNANSVAANFLCLTTLSAFGGLAGAAESPFTFANLSAPQAIDGSAMQAIDGSGLNTISGRAIPVAGGIATQAIDGSAVQAIDGSGIRAIDGSAIMGMHITAVVDSSGIVTRVGTAGLRSDATHKLVGGRITSRPPVQKIQYSSQVSTVKNHLDMSLPVPKSAALNTPNTAFTRIQATNQIQPRSVTMHRVRTLNRR